MKEKKRLLVLSVDVDADLLVKAGIKGPIIGRKANLDSAGRFALSDPTDSDANTMFQAVKIYDDLKREGFEVEVATLTGSPKLGFQADREIASQLESVLYSFPAQSCVFVTDGASDEQILPIIQSRIKIDSVKQVIIKQTKELEKTYFVILEKLKEPHFARIVFGIPAVTLILYAVFGFTGLRFFIGFLGVYLLFKAFGIEEFFARNISRVSLSFDKPHFYFYLVAIPLAIVSFYLGFAKIFAMQVEGISNPAKLIAGFFSNLLLVLPLALVLVSLGRIADGFYEKKKYLVSNQLLLIGVTFITSVIVYLASEWVLGNVGFGIFFFSLIFGLILMYVLNILITRLHFSIIEKLHLDGKEVYTDVGGYLGKVIGVSRRGSKLVVQSQSGARLDFDFYNIARIGEKIIIKY